MGTEQHINNLKTEGWACCNQLRGHTTEKRLLIQPRGSREVGKGSQGRLFKRRCWSWVLKNSRDFHVEYHCKHRTSCRDLLFNRLHWSHSLSLTLVPQWAQQVPFRDFQNLGMDRLWRKQMEPLWMTCLDNACDR